MKLQTINLLSKFSDTKGLTIINKPHWKLKRHTWNKQLSLNSYLANFNQPFDDRKKKQR